MHSIRNIFLILTALNFTTVYSQESIESDFPPLNYSATSRVIVDDYIPYSFKNQVINSQFKTKPATASQSIFVNSERPLPDGTSWRKYSDIDYLRLSSMIGVMGAANLIAYMYQRQVWYTEKTSSFHAMDFAYDWGKYQQMDKFGHFLDAYFTSDLSGKVYRWSGISGDESVWYGALTGWLWMLEIEISDAFMAEWGFSWGDMLANTAGSAFYVLQQFNYDALGGIHPKFSWHKSDAWKEMIYTKDPKALIEDYEGMTFWVTVNPHHYFPSSWKKEYPEWLAPLGLAFGVSAKDISWNPFGGHKEYFLGLDVDLRKLPVWGNSDLMKFIASEVNFLRMPMPTIRFSPKGTWFGFYF